MLIFAFDKTTPSRPRRRQSTQRFDNYIKLNTMALIYCKDCGKQVSDTAANCPYCGSKMRAVNPNASEKDWLTTLLLCFFLGGLGIHSFYTGQDRHRRDSVDNSGRLRYLGADRFHHDYLRQLSRRRGQDRHQQPIIRQPCGGFGATVAPSRSRWRRCAYTSFPAGGSSPRSIRYASYAISRVTSARAAE